MPDQQHRFNMGCLAAYDVLARLPTQKNSRIEELLPHNWTPSIN